MAWGKQPQSKGKGKAYVCCSSPSCSSWIWKNKISWCSHCTKCGAPFPNTGPPKQPQQLEMLVE
eukprot:4364373-Prorocentrum_lima.AAC.1